MDANAPLSSGARHMKIIKMKNIFITYFSIILFSVTCFAQPPNAESSTNDDKVIAVVYDTKIHMNEKDNLVGIVFGLLLQQYAKKHNIEPTKAEIEAFIDKLKEQQIQSRKQWRQERTDILRKLESHGFSESERQNFKSQLETLNNILEVDPELEKYTQENPQKVKKMEEGSAKRSIQSWKINKALFHQYGGRVIFQQAGPEPIDAYRDFLKEEEQKGSFQILDKNFEATFWDYFINENIHVFVTETQEEAIEVFETPWWLLDKPINE